MVRRESSDYCGSEVDAINGPITDIDLTHRRGAGDPDLAVDTRPRRSSWTVPGCVLAVILTVGSFLLLLGGSGDPPAPSATEPRRTSEMGPGQPVRDPARSSPQSAHAPALVEVAETLSVADGLSVADTNATSALVGEQSNLELALVDADGVRIADLVAGTVSQAVTIGPVISPMVIGDGSLVFVADGELIEVDPSGTHRVVGSAVGEVVEVGREVIWMQQGRIGATLTAIDRRTGLFRESRSLPAGSVLVGFVGGRALVETKQGQVVRYRRSGAVEVVTAGVVVAGNDHQLLVRRCGDAACGQAVLVDLVRATEAEVELAPGIAAFGDPRRALSPDGRWLVGLSLGDRRSPEVALYPIGAVGSGGGRAALTLPVGVLGFGGRAVGVTWSPDGSLLASPGSSRVALIDVARRTIVTLPISLEGAGPTVAWVAR